MVSEAVFWAQADSHVENIGDPEYDANNADGTANWLSWIAAANAAEPDAALNIGDLAQTGYNAEEAGGYLDTLTVTPIPVLGNHDVNPQEVGVSTVAEQKANCLTYYSMSNNYYAQDVGFVRVIVMDSTYDENGDDVSSLTGNITDEQITWLENELNTTTQDAVLILMHHPPITGRFVEAGITALAGAIGTRTNVWIVTGHVHPSTQWTRTCGNAVVWVMVPMVDAGYSTVTVQKMSNGLCRVVTAEQSV